MTFLNVTKWEKARRRDEVATIDEVIKMRVVFVFGIGVRITDFGQGNNDMRMSEVIDDIKSVRTHFRKRKGRKLLAFREITAKPSVTAGVVEMEWLTHDSDDLVLGRSEVIKFDFEFWKRHNGTQIVEGESSRWKLSEENVEVGP